MTDNYKKVCDKYERQRKLNIINHFIDQSTKYKVNIRDLYIDYLMYQDMGMQPKVAIQYIDYRLGLGTEYHTIDDEVNKE